MKRKLKKSIQAFIFGLVIGIQSFVMPIHAEGITTPSVQPDFTQVPDDTFFRDVDFQAVAKDLTKALVVFGNTLTGSTNPYDFTWNGFKNYLEYKESLVLEQHPTIGVRNKLDGSYEYDIPQELKQEIVNFVNVEVKGNPLTYKQCYISSYNYLNPNQFNNFTLYSSVKEVIKEHDLSFIMAPNGWDTYNGRYAYICCVDRSKCDINFYGTTINGVFSSVNIEHNWSQFGFPYNQEIEGIEYYMFSNNKTTLGYGKTIQACWYNHMGYNGSNWAPSTNGTIKNTTGIGTSTNALNVFTGKSKDELVYVFDTLNAYKNYNAGMPQQYYFTSEGMEDNWTAPTGYVNSNNVDNSYRYYNNVVSNVQSGWTAEEVLALVDKVTSSSSNGSNSGSSDKDDDDDENWLDGLFSGIVGTIKGIITEISDGIVGIIHMVFGYDDDEGVHHDGVLTNIITMLSGGFTGFLTDIFSFLPSEFVALFTAFLTLSILFGVIKLIRGA